MNQIKVANGEYLLGVENAFTCPVVGRITKCIGNPIHFTHFEHKLLYHPEYEVAISHAVTRRGVTSIQERFYMVLFEDIEAVEMEDQAALEFHKEQKKVQEDTALNPFDDGDFYL